MIQSPSPLVKIQIKYCWESLLDVKGQNIARRWCQQRFCFKSLLTTPSNVLPKHLRQTLDPIIWIYTEGVGDEIQSRLPFKIFSTLMVIIQSKWVKIKRKLLDHFPWGLEILLISAWSFILWSVTCRHRFHENWH